VLQQGVSYDLLLTDVVMPDGMTGYQLAAAARTLLPELRVVFTTGYVRSEHGGQATHPGITLRKPYRRQELAATVRAALDA